MKRTILAVACMLCFNAHADEEINLNAKSVIVIDTDTQEVIVEKQSNEVRSIASITKLMTAIVTLDANLPLEEKITITAEEVKATTIKGHGPEGGLPVGLTLTRAEILHLALMSSKNSAAAALARTYPGGTEAFVAAMNNKATNLGLVNTKFVDPTGLYNDNVSTARELAVLTRHASDYVLISDLSTSNSFEATMYFKKKKAKVHYGTTNYLVTSPNWNVVVQKTGFIKNAGRCVVMMAKINYKNVAIVFLGGTSQEARIKDATLVKYYIEHGVLPTNKQLVEEEPRLKRTIKVSKKSEVKKKPNVQANTVYF